VTDPPPDGDGGVRPRLRDELVGLVDDYVDGSLRGRGRLFRARAAVGAVARVAFGLVDVTRRVARTGPSSRLVGPAR
jgi:hypothetical protein